MYHIPKIIQKLFPGVIWSIPNSENKVFLTFDDGPDPEGTPRILDILAEYDARATFFCLGRQVEKFPALFERIKKEGHEIGNHTFNHISGWTTSHKKYFADIEKANAIIGSKLFRPPYGRIKPSQIRALKEQYKIVMWDVLSGDYERNLTSEACLRNVVDKARIGSIIVMHDNLIENQKRGNFLISVLKSVWELKFEFGLIG